MFDSLTNSSDLELPDDLIAMFRSYPWSYKNFLSEKMFDLISQIYTGKSLIRKCTNYSSNFEMIGEWTSKQSIGNILMGSTDVNQHHYYCEIMNMSLLPHVNILLNVLVEEAITAKILLVNTKYFGITNSSN